MSTTAFLGMSHLGINYAAAWSSFGQPTVGLDADAALVARLQSARLPIQEPGLVELIGESAGDLRFSADFSQLSECQLAIVALDVVTDDHDRSDLSQVRSLIEAATRYLPSSATLVIMSQIPPGFMRELATRLSGQLAGVYYWVETLIFGDAVRRALKPERIIIGCADPAAPLPDVLVTGLAHFGCPVLPMRYESAELTKTAINLYLIGSVTFANTLSELCEAVGARWSEMVPALRMDARIGAAAYLRPSLGVGGGNLERDLVTLRTLSGNSTVDPTYLDGLIQYNAHRLDWVRRQLDRRIFNWSVMPRLAVWGLTYKKNTRSTRNSPSVRVIASLEGRARVRAWDPAIGPGEVLVSADVLNDQYLVLDDADALLVMADWDQFAEADLARLRQSMRHALVIDCVGVLERRQPEMRGIEYVGMGW
jgi:UDPglucose 6-dehydrogenase